MKKWIIPILALGIIGAAIAYYMWNKPVASLERKKPDVEISAAQLISEYEADENTANEKYLGKIIQVNGKVNDITIEEGRKKVTLETGNLMSLIICEVEEGKETGDLKPGDEVKMKGMCSGYLSDVILVQSTVVNP